MKPFTRWDGVRATLIAALLMFQLLDAIPLPELRQHHLSNPVAQQEIRQWTQRLRSVGVDMTPDELADLGLRVGRAAGTYRKHVLRPWAPVRRFTGTGQDWSLFAVPEPASGRLVVDGHTAAGEVTAFYRAPGGRGDELEAMLEYHRLRGVYDSASDRPKPRKVYRHFGRWLSVHLMQTHPELTEVEIRLDRHLIRTPDEAPAPPDTRRHAQTFTRAELEADGRLEGAP